MPTQPLPDRLTPLAAQAGIRAWYGDIHNHCALSYGHGSLDAALQNAKRQLDFVSVTGHAYWPDMPVDDPRVAHIVDFHVKGFARLKRLWPGHFEQLANYQEAGKFTVFPGYEMHSMEHGDYTIVLREIDQRQMPKGDSPHELNRALRDKYGNRAFAFPHHIGYRTGARGINWDTFEEALSPVVEMISMHGCSETSLTDRPFLHSMGPSNGTNTIHHGLNRGFVFGVVGNTDHHSGFPGSYGHGRSAVFAAENTSEAIWDAIHARHTGALTGDNCHLFGRIGGAHAGDFISPSGNATMEIEAVAGSFIDYIDVIKNGAIVHRVTPCLTPSPMDSGKDALETLLVVELGWGERKKSHDWTGRISLKGGTFHSVEPRLRGPEIVSPLEGDDHHHHDDCIELVDNDIRFAVRSTGNPNNSTAATQSFAARVRLDPDAEILAEFDGQTIAVSASRLMTGALSGNLGPIDSPAYRFHPLPRPGDWQWHGSVGLGELRRGDWVTIRMRQQNGQWAWSSPFFCR